MFERELIAVEFRLVSFVYAFANVGIVIPVNRSGLGRVAANLVRRKILDEPDFVI